MTQSPSAGAAARVAAVTGAGEGFGRAIALTLGAAGYVTLCADVDATAAEATASAIRERGGAALSVVVDVRRRADAALLVDTAVQRHGRLDVLVNVAGVIRAAPFLDLTDDEWRHSVDVNLTGTFLCAQEAARQMVAQESGAIVNVISGHSLLPRHERSAHGAAKAAVAHLTRSLALELAGHGIRVSAVDPTDMVFQDVLGAMLGLSRPARPARPTRSPRPARSGHPPRSSAGGEPVYRAIEHIQSRLGERLTVAAVAHGTGYSADYLNRVFHRETGMALHEYISRAKVEYAARLLIRGADSPSVARIAEQAGFSSAQHFWRTFKRVRGVSPSAFRRHQED